MLYPVELMAEEKLRGHFNIGCMPARNSGNGRDRALHTLRRRLCRYPRTGGIIFVSTRFPMP